MVTPIQASSRLSSDVAPSSNRKAKAVETQLGGRSIAHKQDNGKAASSSTARTTTHAHAVELPSNASPSEPSTSAPVEASAVAKGKRRVRTPSVYSQGSDDEGSLHLSDMSEWERSQFERAILESKKPVASGSLGESSRQGLLSTPHELSTPQATAMFTTPAGSQGPRLGSSPQSPTPTRKPMTVRELLNHARAIAGDTPSASTPASSATSSSTQACSVHPANRIRLIVRCQPADIPVICEVTHRELWDMLLADQYELLVHLRSAGYIIPWSCLQGPGLVKFSAWAEQCPNMNAVVALAAINAEGTGHILNPSRCSPVGMGLYTPPNTVDCYHFYVGGDDPAPLVAFSTGLLEHSQLLAPSDAGLHQKWVRVIMHSQEWHQYTGFIRMVSGHESLHSQYNKDALQFSTRPLNRSLNNPTGKPHEDSKRGNHKGLRVPASKMFTGGSSVPGNRITADTFSLAADAIVPVYDARQVDTYDFNTNLSRLAETLPVWTEGEIPYGSFVVVGHTLSVFRSGAGNWTLGCNLQWVIVVATPDEDGDEEQEEDDV